MSGEETLREAHEAVGREHARRGRLPPEDLPIGNNRILIAITFAVALCVGAIATLATGSWWLLAFPLLVHFLGTVLVLRVAAGALGRADKPSPTEAARLAEQPDVTDTEVEH